MYAGNCHVDGVLDHSVIPLNSDEVAVQIVVDLNVIETCVVLAGDLSDLVEFLMERTSHERSHVEVKCRNRLTSVHLVLDGLHGDAAQDAGCLDPLCRA